MAKPRKRKAGLHKKVSSVFEGVSIPQADDIVQTLPKSTTDGSCDASPKPTPKDSLVSQSSLMKKVRQAKRTPAKAATKTTKKAPSKRTVSTSSASKDSPTRKTRQAKNKTNKKVKTTRTATVLKQAASVPSASKDSTPQQTHRVKGKTDKAIERTSKRVLPKPTDLDPPALLDSMTQTSRRKKDKPNKTIEDIVKTVFSKQPALEPDSTIPRPHRTEDKPDKAASRRPVGSLPKLTNIDHLIPHLSPTKKPSRAKVSSEKTSSGRPISVPPKLTRPEQTIPELTTPDDPILELTLGKEPLQTVNAPDNEKPERTVEIPSKETASTHATVQTHQVNDSPQKKDSPNDEHKTDHTLSIPSWMMSPDSTDSQGSVTTKRKPDHPISRDSSTKTSDPMKIIRDEIEAKTRRSDDSLKSAAAGASAFKGSLYRKLLRAENTSEISEPDTLVEAASTLKSEERQTSQEPELEKRYDPEAPQQDADSSSSPETTDLGEASRPNLRQRIHGKLFAPKPGVNSTRQKAMVVLIPILIIILIFAFRQVLSKSPQKTKGTPVKDDASEVVVKAEPVQEIEWQIPEPLPATMRDPTVLTVQDKPTQTEQQQQQQSQTTIQKKSDLINLGSIVYSEDKSSAIVNGRIVHAGDQISGITVLRINKDSVEFEKDGERWLQKKHR